VGKNIRERSSFTLKNFTYMKSSLTKQKYAFIEKADLPNYVVAFFVDHWAFSGLSLDKFRYYCNRLQDCGKADNNQSKEIK